MIRFEGVTKYFKDTDTLALEQVSFHVPVGGFYLLNGESGSGKTTLLRLIMRELEADEGKIWINGQEIGQIRRGKIPFYRRKIGFVFQDFRLLADRNVYENVALARRISGAGEADVMRQVTAALKLVGLEEQFRRFPRQLSGGQQQKVCIARAIAGKPQLLLADEPTGNLDPESSREIMRLLKMINERGTTVLAATHDWEACEELDCPCLRILNRKVRVRSL